MGINLNPFTWWNGASWGTMLYGLRGKARVGEDELGNVYYEGGTDTAGNPRRWVIYQGSNDASRVPPDWFSWLHHQIDDVPSKALPPVRPWQKPALPNLTGTPLAYRPSGALEKGGVRAAATGDYEAWTPEG
ncbi:NADH:ubiquinone oxidoreductase subunit [Sphingomonas sp. SORGH_AS802]|jgi:NADH:ubiquinone oxidoreductase subunit|uniref:NADH:ubiquinone oxidoreductase subunit NDUFA12 n=1 Tax=unclassified Sphingomonas TaxID=196159 RepID=UPI000F7EA317|nr:MULTISPECIES: NADH:ubiquinone oxidoreductase subunit NDUFA12 [unclassified Sphingomonas]MDR6126159.1 NADH:ubiquinone oxidoreductase subunit [Sphingomonas sp. SORGH_AS_0438]MDR6135995.1 NADH:ubiquinone oxidoreductase subunit [Sphingomonas sp. SORGH_AS_0802]RSU51762.1 NADH:ubiquinone oxidoreductase subunit NDUFA12 [Sphingomonas sp. S-NIH.Pt15_0812]